MTESDAVEIRDEVALGRSRTVEQRVVQVGQRDAQLGELIRIQRRCRHVCGCLRARN
jgi:hypothetical protein